MKKVADDYARILSPEWRRDKNDFMRQDGSGWWLQIVAFNPSRWDSEYNPTASLGFLAMSGELLGGISPQLLNHSNGSQRWISSTEHANDLPRLYGELVAQFRPAIDRPLNDREIVSVLKKDLAYWPHPYALCVDACQRGDRAAAQEFLVAFKLSTAKKDYPEITQRREELHRYVEMIDTPDALRGILASIRDENLRSVGLGR